MSWSMVTFQQIFMLLHISTNYFLYFIFTTLTYITFDFDSSRVCWSCVTYCAQVKDAEWFQWNNYKRISWICNALESRVHGGGSGARRIASASTSTSFSQWSDLWRVMTRPGRALVLRTEWLGIIDKWGPWNGKHISDCWFYSGFYRFQVRDVLFTHILRGSSCVKAEVLQVENERSWRQIIWGDRWTTPKHDPHYSIRLF